MSDSAIDDNVASWRSQPFHSGRYCAEENAHILWGANVRSEEAAEELVHRLNARALLTMDASKIEAVQVPS